MLLNLAELFIQPTVLSNFLTITKKKILIILKCDVVCRTHQKLSFKQLIKHGNVLINDPIDIRGILSIPSN